MPFKLAIADKILTKVKGIKQEADGTEKPYEFKLLQDRLSQEELDKAHNDPNESASDFIKRITHDWQGQSLVLEEDGKTPAQFSQEALGALLTISGMAGLIYVAYRTQVAVRAKN